MRDEIFKEKLQKQFEFDESVVSVFDDMIDRSVPFYKEQVFLIAHFASLALKNGGRAYDLGSSTGNVLFELYKAIPKNTELIGLDSSLAMIERARLKAKAYEACNISFLHQDFLEYDFLPSEVMIASWTMQFVRPLMREKMIKKIYESLKEGGIFLMSEKMVSSDKVLDRLMIEKYYQYKSTQGYSQIEINQKREALENVLVPYTQEENYSMLKNAGFKSVEVLFKWVNFALLIARK